MDVANTGGADAAPRPRWRLSRSWWQLAGLMVGLAMPVLLAGQGSTPAASDSSGQSDSSMADMPGMKMSTAHATQPAHAMHMAPNPLGIPMMREASGTAWQPDATPMYGHHFDLLGWQWMVHGLAFATYDAQHGGRRGGDQFGSTNWGMVMASHAVGAGLVQFRGMFSAEPWTVTDRGYPLLLQTGEAYNGAPLHDIQHPHNLFMELAADYQAPIAKKVGLEIYAAPVGEPAVGPVAFPHRLSASADPFAPLSHHWQDATHVSFGVLTAGLFTHDVKVEGSIFNGREPDQRRTDLEYTEHSPTLDSYSGRVTVNPSAPWSLSSWYAYLRTPEQLAPKVSVRRFGASLLNTRKFGTDGVWASTFVWGANLDTGHEPGGAPVDRRVSNSALAETSLDFDGWNTLTGRIEYVNKSARDLDIGPTVPDRFDVGSFSAGYIREIGAFTKFGSAGIGALVMLDVVPAELRAYYDTRTPWGFGIFLRLRPFGPRSKEGMGSMGDMGGMHM